MRRTVGIGYLNASSHDLKVLGSGVSAVMIPGLRLLVDLALRLVMWED